MDKAEYIRKVTSELISILDGVIDDELEVISSCREINRLRYELGLQDESVFRPIVAIESESDHFILDKMPETQRSEYAEFVNDVKKDVVDCCIEIKAAILKKMDSQPPPD